MSRENVEIVRRAVEIFQGGDPADVFAEGLVAPDAQWHAARNAGTYVGAEGFVELIGDWTEDFHDYAVRLTDVRDLGDRVLALAHQRGVGKGSGVSVEMSFGMLFTLRDGLITDVRVVDRAEGLEAAELSE